MRLSGCPSLTIRRNPDALRVDPIAYVDNSCVGCGVCGTNAHSAVLCPSFARVDIVINPSLWDRLLRRVRGGIIGALQRWRDARQARQGDLNHGSGGERRGDRQKGCRKDCLKGSPKNYPKNFESAPVSLSSKRTFSLVIAALGGEGGGVLADWVTTAARKEGWISQSTSVPGVAQRTGATIYYVELFAADEADKPPVMALFPMAGDVDVVLASEALEAARMVKQGLVTGDCTTLIASDSRAYMVNEKMAAGDGIADQELLVESARKASKQFIHFDMQEQTQRHGTIISATMLGALAGSGALPFKRASWESAIRDSGSRGVEASLASFAESYQRVSKPED